jgi:DNA (cytosine-5)-methyltransferase 1
MKYNNKYVYKIGSLYAGVGGICQGFINAGMQISWANEYDHNACITYSSNFNHQLYEKDVWLLDPEELDKIDILVAGFPCQPFSIAGHKKGFEDERGNHFFRIMHYVEVLQPKVIFLENVRNLQSHDGGRTFNTIMSLIMAKGYSFNYKVMNTKDYGNLPQNRERIYMVCFRNDMASDFTFPEPIERNIELKDLISTEDVAEKYYYKEDKKMYSSLIKDMKNTETAYQWRRTYVRENKQNLCPTLTANMGTGGHNVPLVLTKKGIRKLTPKECFIIQGFKNNFILPKISDSSLYKQAGNSVSVPVIERIANQIKIALDR